MLLQLQLKATVPVLHIEAALRKGILQCGRERIIRPNLRYGLKCGGKVAAIVMQDLSEGADLGDSCWRIGVGAEVGDNDRISSLCVRANKNVRKLDAKLGIG